MNDNRNNDNRNADNANLENRRAALWDVDGTLIDSSEYHWLSWQGALAAENFPVTREQFAKSFGQRNDEILRSYFPDITTAENFPVTREQFAKSFGQRNDEILRSYFPDITTADIARVGDAKEEARSEERRVGK